MNRLSDLKKGKIMKYILFMLLSLLIFINMNRIVYFFFDESVKIHKIDFDDYNVDNPAYAYLREFEYYKDEFREILYCAGWAFAETTEPNDNKSIYLIFKGERNAYMTNKCVISYSSLQDEVQGWKNIYGSNHNFTIEVSTLLLPADTYEIYIYVEENEKAKGIVNVGQGFKKNGVKLYSYRLGEIVDSIDPEQINNVFDDGWLDGVLNENECIVVAGWEVIKNKNSENSKYYLVFIGNNHENVTLQIPNTIRLGAGKSLGNYDQNACGFRGALDKKSLPDKAGVVYVIAENTGEFYKTDAYSYDIDAKENE